MKMRNLLSGCLGILLCLPVTYSYAQFSNLQSATPLPASQLATVNGTKMTPVESFIMHVGETNKFVQVSNIWQADNNFDQTALLQNVKKVQPLTINYTAVSNLIATNPLSIDLVVPGINGGTYTIRMSQFSPLSSDLTVTAKSGSHETPYAYTPGKYYSGIVKGYPGSVAAFSFFKNEVYGIFSIPNVGNIVLVPNAMVHNSYNYNPNYILYNDVDLTITNLAPKCSTNDLEQDFVHTANRTTITTTTLNNNVYNVCKLVNVMELGDYQFYLDKGSNVATATNYLTALFNNEAVLYRNEGIIINLKHVQINTSTDVYQTLTSSSTAFLNAFGDDIQNTYKTNWGCNVAMLATTRYGSMGGVAWVGVMCANYSAGSHVDATAIANIDNSSVTSFPTYSWDVEVLTHEMGHNVGSHHTHACVWNPQYTGNTAIDGCYTLEGSCAIPTPALPVGGGTIMSYCHLTSDGINFSNGFGPQPGSVIRDYVNSTAPTGNPNAPTNCAPEYNPTTALATTNRTISANRECLDMTSGITYYWNDHNTADQTDDTLVLMIKKGSNNIGDLNTTGFAVTANTVVRYGTGTGDTISFPSGTSSSLLSQNYSMRRYWQITGGTNPTSPVEVMFPFLSTDTADVHGSMPGNPSPITSYLVYKTDAAIDPNPVNNFPGAASGDFTIYSYAGTASTSNWSLSTVGSTQLAHILTSNINGGGAGFYTYCPILATPTGPAPTAPCPGTPVTYTINPVSGASSYTWTVTGSGWSGTSTTNSINLTAGTGTANIYVSAVASCGGASVPLHVTMTTAPLATESISLASSHCVGGSNVTLAATATGGSPTSYSWAAYNTLGASGWSGSGSGSSFTATAGTGNGMIVVTGSNSCGVGPNDTFYIAMDETAPSAPVSIIPPALACPSTINSFSTPVITDATSYTWSVAGTGWSGSSSGNTISVNVGTGLGTLTVSASNACGTSSNYSQSFTPGTAPGSATAITGPSDPCSGSVITYTTTPVATASSYNWSVLGTGWSGSSSSNTINVTVGTAPATITVSPVNACGVGGAYTLSPVTSIMAPSSAFAVSSHIVPVNQDIIAVYTGSAPAGSSFLWDFSGGTGTPGTGSGPQTIHWASPGQYILFLTVSDGGTCHSATADTIDVLAGTGVNSVNVEKVGASIVPNPNNGTFDILFSDAVAQPVSIKMFDMQGKVVYKNDFANALSKKLSVETIDLPSGTYTITIYVNESVISKKVTIYK